MPNYIRDIVNQQHRLQQMVDFITQYQSGTDYREATAGIKEQTPFYGEYVWVRKLIAHFKQTDISYDGDGEDCEEYDDPDTMLEKIEVGVREYHVDSTTTVFTRVLLRPSVHIFQVNSMALRRGVPLKSRSKQQRLLMMRYLNKVNGRLSVGKFLVDPFDGRITLSLERRFPEDICQQDSIGKLVACVEEGIKSMTNTLRFHYYKLGYMLGEYSFQEVRELARKSYLPVRQVRVDQESIGVLQKVLAYGNQPHEFMRHAVLEQVGLATPLPEGMRKQDSVSPKKALVGLLSARLAHYNTPPLTERIDASFSSKSLLELANVLKLPTIKAANPAQKNSILNSIHILNQNKVKWDKVSMGGFSLIAASPEVTLVYLDRDSEQLSEEQFKLLPNRFVEKPLVRKTDMPAHSQKVLHEKSILKTIAEKSCPYIVKFMESSQLGCEKALFMDFCPLRALDKYVTNNQTTMGQVTSLYLLHQVAQALRFLSLNRIHHLDVKPQNILLARNLVVKLTDFGESYHSEVQGCQNKEFRPGFTLPYSCPEIFQSIIPYSPALDVFSFGTVAYELLFNRVPIEVSRRSQGVLRQHYRGEIDLHSLIVPEMVGERGDKSICQILLCLLLQCQSRNPSARPLLEWNSVALRLTFLLFNRLY